MTSLPADARMALWASIIPGGRTTVEALFKDNEIFKTLLDNIHEGVYFVDTDRRIQY